MPSRGESPGFSNTLSEVFNESLPTVENPPISGKRVHDARWVAALKANHLDHLLTFNAADFNVFTGVSVVSPSALAA